MSAVQGVANLDQLSMGEAEQRILSGGFVFHHETRGGYLEYRHSDGSVIWIRPTGEVVRLGAETAW